MPNDSQPNKPQAQSTALKLQVVNRGRRVAGGGSRAQAPAPFLHLHPANANAPENVGLPKPPPAEAPAATVEPPKPDEPATPEGTTNG